MHAWLASLSSFASQNRRRKRSIWPIEGKAGAPAKACSATSLYQWKKRLGQEQCLSILKGADCTLSTLCGFSYMKAVANTGIELL